MNNTDEQDKSIFLKVPLTGPNAENFKDVSRTCLAIADYIYYQHIWRNYALLFQVNVRENLMLGQVLPRLQYFIETNCTGGLKGIFSSSIVFQSRNAVSQILNNSR